MKNKKNNKRFLPFCPTCPTFARLLIFLKSTINYIIKYKTIIINFYDGLKFYDGQIKKKRLKK